MLKRHLAVYLVFLLTVVLCSTAGLAAEIRSSSSVLTRNFVAAWQRADAVELASLWAADGDWMSITGSRRAQSGREAIQGVWEIGLQGRETAEQRRLDIAIDAVREYGDDLHQIDAVMTFGSPETGQIREALTAILVRVEGDWLIASARVARIESIPPTGDQ